MNRTEAPSRTKYAACRITPEERALLEAAAARRGEVFLSEFVREVVLDAVRAELGLPEQTEPEAEEVGA